MADYDGGSASVRIRPNMSRFTTDLDADLRRVQATVEVAARVGDIDDAELQAWRARQESNAVTVTVRTDTSAIDRAIDALRGAGSGGGVGGAGGFNVSGLMLGLSPALIDPVIASVGALSTSILQLSESALVLPGLFAGAGASLGTFTVGINGIEDAYKALDKASDGSAKSIAAANAAMADLAPNARDFLTTFMDVKNEFLDNDIQQNLFTNLGSGLRDLANRDLPILKSGMESIATGLNSNIQTLFASLGSDQGQGILDRILGNTSEAQAKFSAAIDPLVRGLGTLTAAGTDALPRLSDAIADASNRFATFIETADQDGSLTKWIDEGVTAVGDLLGTLKNLGDSFVSVARNAGGEGLLGSLEKLTGTMADWLRTAEGQRRVKQFFDDAKDAAADWIPILQQIPGFIEGVINAGREIAEVVVPPLAQISEILGEHPALIEAVVVAFAAWQAIAGVAALITTLGTISTALSVGLPAAAVTGAAGISAALAGVALPAWLTWLINDQTPDGRDNTINGKDPQDASFGDKLKSWMSNGFPDQPNTANTAPSPPPARTNDLPPVDRPSFPPPPPGTVLEPGVPPITNDLPPSQWNPQPTPLNPKNPFSGYASGGYTDWPASEGRASTLHGREFVQQASAVAKYGVPFMDALNQGLVDPRALAHLAGGGTVIDEYGNPVTPGIAPGPSGTLPQQQASGGLMSAFGSFLGGIGAPLNNALSLGSGLLGQAPGIGAGGPGAAPGATSYNGYSNPIAAVPGLIGLFGSLGGANPASDLMQWGNQTASWLGDFVSGTAMKFGTTLWQGLLGFVGLDNSILSPNNPYTQDVLQGLGYYGDLTGTLSGSSRRTSAAGRPTDKQLREAQDAITDRDAQVAISEARFRELPADASESQRLSAQNAVDRARREAAQARIDLGSLTQGGGTVLDSAGALGGLPAAAPTSGSGSERWRGVVRSALATYGPQFGITNYQAWEDAMVRQLQTESGGNPAAYNGNDSNGRGGRQVVQGIGQFLRSTFDANNITGGDYLDPTAQIAAMIPYVARKYGMDATGAPLQIGRGVGYSSGGEVRGIGGPTSDLVPAMLSAKEHVFSAADVDAMGGQDNVYAFRAALHAGVVRGHAAGNQPQLTPAQQQAWQAAMTHAPIPPPRPSFDPGPGINRITPTGPAAPSGGRGGAPAAGPDIAAPPAPAAVDAPPAAAATPGFAQAPAAGFQLNAPAPSSYDHNLPAVNTAIQSTATTLGNIAAQAASMGLGAVGGGGFSGLAGSAIQGGAQQIGKIVQGVTNVFSSAGVGNLTLGDPTAPVYGVSAITAQPQPQTLPGRYAGMQNSFYGLNERTLLRELETKQAQDAQGSFAGL